MSLLSLTSEWIIAPDCQQDAIIAVERLAQQVLDTEPDTLIYLIHTPRADTAEAVSVPPAHPRSIVFFEVYRNLDAFVHHVSSPIFITFVKNCSGLFVGKDGAPYTTVAFLNRHAGFLRSDMTTVAVCTDTN